MTISTRNIVTLWLNILCSHLQRFRKWKSVHDLSINNINDQNIGINLFMGTLYFCSILQGVYAPYSECCAHLYRYALDCDSVCAPFLASEVVSLMSVTLFRYSFLFTPLPYSDWSSFYQFVTSFWLVEIVLEKAYAAETCMTCSWYKLISLLSALDWSNPKMPTT